MIQALTETSSESKGHAFPIRDELIDNSFRVPRSVHWLSGLVTGLPRLWTMLGNLETWTLGEVLREITIDRPIYIAGIARSGSTVLLEALATHAEVATHQYRDFPCLFTPYWWQKAQASRSCEVAEERAHGDGIMVTSQSPEAMEEVLWQAFFPGAHDPEHSQVLTRETEHPAFETFYRQHIRKLVAIRQGRRYVSKGNYNFSRLGFLQKMFPDMRCLVPIRHPQAHIASLMKQHALFTRGERRYPLALKHMQRVGHFEFGLDRRPINVGDTATIREIQEWWATGEEVRGWARYWAHLYGWMADQLETDDELRKSTIVVRYEDMCADPTRVLDELREQTGLDHDGAFAEFAGRIHAPTYYRPQFSPIEERVIHEETAETAARFGYDAAAASLQQASRLPVLTTREL